MKKVTQIFVLAIIILFLFSCKKNDTNTTAQRYISMKVNGTDWKSDDGQANGFISKSGNSLTVTGKKGTDVIAIFLPVVTGTGTFSITSLTTPGSGTFNFSTTPGSIPKNYAVSSSKPKSRATITVSRINPGTSLLDYPEGTFNAVLYTTTTDSIVITNGEFKIQ